MGKYTIKTLGCKVNRCDSSAIGALLEARGYLYTAQKGKAEVIVINTCAVTAEAERKSRQAVRKAIADNPGAKVIACGCAVQRDPQAYRQMPGLYFAEGTGCRESVGRGEKLAAEIAPLPEVFEELDATAQQEHTRAFVKVQEGCDNFCSYCVIPYLRGKPRSRREEFISAQCTRLVAAGYKEIVLTGINIAKYGQDLPGDVTLFDALAAAAVPGVQRLRLGSLEPEGMKREFFDRLMAAKLPFCPQFHVSLQSGSSATLAAMNRHYDAEQYRAGIELIREYYPQAGITTDVIVGFPGEGEREFEESLAFVREMNFSKVHVFPFSPRPGTVAAEMADQVSPAEKQERAKRMGAVAEESATRFYASLVGQRRSVLLETPVKGMPGYMEGLGEDYSRIWVKTERARGDIVQAEVLQAFGDYAIGEPVKEERPI